MLLLGIDIGTSFIKVSVVDAVSQKCISTAQYPETENAITSLQSGWAEQSPEMWWDQTAKAIRKLTAAKAFDPKDIAAIGISYQMHGLVAVDKHQNVVRDSIIWCDSRAVEIGENAFNAIGEYICSSCLLNSPANFTASKLSWVKNNEAGIYEKIDKIMLPGDFIAMKLTGEITTTNSALSEGIFYDFQKEEISKDVMNYFGFDDSLMPDVRTLFSSHGNLLPAIAKELSLKENIPVTYKAGDQLNNALSLNVLEPGEVAATAGTSGVIYAVTDQLFNDKYSRVNAFAHVNHTAMHKRLGVLLCINGTGIMNSWIKKVCGDGLTYEEMDAMCSGIDPGSDGLFILPFGNGAERMLQNKIVGAHINNIDLNKHSKAHIFRAVQEGIAFAFRYGLDIMRENNLHPTIIRAGRSNLFLSDVFIQSFVNATGVAVELYSNDGSVGAALGAGIGGGIYKNFNEAFSNFKPIKKIEPGNTDLYDELYLSWKKLLEAHLKK
ncbi:carbohydrate kinase [Ginsengibacter hankyongi]|uniref:Carbohydrate kinase n=1 Tax=Ginsengibacter hankyongi TaxID=2607284 RepID=A0A5J5IMK3_9BACT|nr:FGGY family carbohydrate kinase [Ginsengibacter hankyongi]KAA9041758.1 carbohydrate kinase [Ginsengibacter hankyongi]